MEFGCDLFTSAGLASPAALATLQKNIINFFHGSPKADGPQGPGNSRADGTGKAVAEGWPCFPTHQLCHRSWVYFVGGQYLYLLVN